MAEFFAATGAASATAPAVGAAAASTATVSYTAGTSLLTASTAANILAGLSAVSMVRQGQAGQVAAEVQADKIKQDATRREVDRRRQLVASLASQNATRAASGIAFLDGSSKNIALEDIRAGEGSFLSDRAGAQAAASSVRTEGQYTRRTGYINAGASLLNQIDRTTQRG